MTTYEEEKRKNLAAYERLKDEIKTRYIGQYVAIADGCLIKVSPSFEEADEAVKDYRHRFVFPAGEEPEIGPIRVRFPKAVRFIRLPGYELIWDLEAGEMTLRKKAG